MGRVGIATRAGIVRTNSKQDALALQEILNELIAIKEGSSEKRKERRSWEKEEHIKEYLKIKKKKLNID